MYSIRFEYYGVDAAEMEKTITIPLEEKIAGLEGIIEVLSTCEYGKSYTTIYFSKKINAKNTYLALRDAVDTLYGTLPQAVQKPRIYSSAADQKPIISVAAFSPPAPNNFEIDELRAYIEKVVKPKIESIDGVSEVIIAGGHLEEIKVEFDSERLASGGINPNALGNAIQDANALSPNGTIKNRFLNTPFVFNTRLAAMGEIGDLPLVISEGVVTQLAYLAGVEKKPRVQDEITTINGRESIVINIKAASGGNSITISRQCKKLIASDDQSSHIDYQTLYDDGEFVFGMIKTLCIAIGQSFLLVIIIIPFFFKTKRTLVLLIVLLPVSIFWSMALLHAAGFSLDQNVLSGISIALGLIVDSALILAELAEKAAEKQAFLDISSRVTRSILSSAITTLLALVPLYFLEYIVPGIRSVAFTIGFMIIASVIISVVFLPCFLYKKTAKSEIVPYWFWKKIQRFCVRSLYRVTAIGMKNERILRVTYLVCVGIPFIVFFASGKNISMEARDAVLPVYIEFDSGKAPDAVEKNSKRIVEFIRKMDAVNFVSAEARKGAMEIEVGFNQDLVSRTFLANAIEELSPYSEDGFLYVPDAASKKKSRILSVEVAVIGDESLRCREIAREAASNIGKMKDAEQVVLNFKDAEEMIEFAPYKDILEKSGTSTSAIATTLRWILFGPVVDKWIQDGREMDIRVSGNNIQDATLERTENIYIPTQTGSVHLTALGEIKKTEGIGKIYRKDARRAAYFTAQMRSRSADKTIADIKNTLGTIPLERGYGFSLSRDLEDLNGQYTALLIAFLGSIVFILLLLSGVTENCLRSLLITSIIPVSAALPLLIKFVTRSPLTMGDIVGMVVLGGIGINNAIYIGESKKSAIRNRVRDKFFSILVTSLTTIVGAVPLAFFAQNEFSRGLAFFMLWGTVSSVIGSVVLFPAMLHSLEKKQHQI
ncbi:acriflavin resistance protein [Spirochaetia bacterium]|nr:acriflavin resistance protein [Spirochaetia bacterium]